MKPCLAPQIITALGLLTTALFAEGDPHAAWQHVQTVEVPGPGLVRIEVPIETLNVSAPRLDDLRLVSTTGIETPYVIEWPQLESVQTKPVKTFRAALQDHATVLELDPGTDKAIRAVVLESSAASFIKAATVEGSNDGTQWLPMAKDEVVFRQPNGASQLRIPFPAGTWTHVRVTLNDVRSEAVAFTGASIEREQPGTNVVSMSLEPTDREYSAGTTKLTVPLGARNLWLAALRVETSEQVFSRRVTVLANQRVIATGRIFRIALDGHEVSNLRIPIDAQVRSSTLKVEIENGDSPPMQVGGIEALRYSVMLAFHADAAGRWKLYSGSPAAQAPNYDMAALADQLRKATANKAKVSSLAANPGFDEKATLPDTGGPGAAIDLNGWAFRKEVTTLVRGLLEVEPDLAVHAHAQSGFADLRIVQNGHQLPYVLHPTSMTHVWQPLVRLVPDAKRPTVSRWELKLPFAGLPISTVTANSPTPLFSRQFTLGESSRDGYGNLSWMPLGSASWNRTRGTAPSLSMTAVTRPQGDTLILETDNGDNGPIEVNNIAMSHSVVELLFNTRDPAPIQLYYGNPQAAPPHYDLGLVEAEINAIPPAHVYIGNEEVLKPVPASEASGQGSPWLWAVLAVVVGGLLWLVAKLLPKQEA